MTDGQNWGQAPQYPQQDEPRGSHRRRRPRWPVFAGIGVLAVAAAGGVTYALAGHGGGTASLATAITRTETCRQQGAAWKTGPARAEVKVMLADLQKMTSEANLEDFPGTDAAIKAAGSAATVLQGYPVPACADPAGYWRQALSYVTAGGDNAGSASSLGGLMLALAPLEKVDPLLGKLTVELKRTTAQ
jgi:hypothetical protein